MGLITFFKRLARGFKAPSVGAPNLKPAHVVQNGFPHPLVKDDEDIFFMMRKCPGSFPLPLEDDTVSDFFEDDIFSRQLIAAANLVEITYAECYMRDPERVLINDGYRCPESLRSLGTAGAVTGSASPTEGAKISEQEIDADRAAAVALVDIALATPLKMVLVNEYAFPNGNIRAASCAAHGFGKYLSSDTLKLDSFGSIKEYEALSVIGVDQTPSFDEAVPALTDLNVSKSSFGSARRLPEAISNANIIMAPHEISKMPSSYVRSKKAAFMINEPSEIEDMDKSAIGSGKSPFITLTSRDNTRQCSINSSWSSATLVEEGNEAKPNEKSCSQGCSRGAPNISRFPSFEERANAHAIETILMNIVDVWKIQEAEHASTMIEMEIAHAAALEAKEESHAKAVAGQTSKISVFTAMISELKHQADAQTKQIQRLENNVSGMESEIADGKLRYQKSKNVLRSQYEDRLGAQKLESEEALRSLNNERLSLETAIAIRQKESEDLHQEIEEAKRRNMQLLQKAADSDFEAQRLFDTYRDHGKEAYDRQMENLRLKERITSLEADNLRLQQEKAKAQSIIQDHEDMIDHAALWNQIEKLEAQIEENKSSHRHLEEEKITHRGALPRQLTRQRQVNQKLVGQNLVLSAQHEDIAHNLIAAGTEWENGEKAVQNLQNEVNQLRMMEKTFDMDDADLRRHLAVIEINYELLAKDSANDLLRYHDAWQDAESAVDHRNHLIAQWKQAYAGLDGKLNDAIQEIDNLSAAYQRVDDDNWSLRGHLDWYQAQLAERDAKIQSLKESTQRHSQASPKRDPRSRAVPDTASEIIENEPRVVGPLQGAKKQIIAGSKEEIASMSSSNPSIQVFGDAEVGLHIDKLALAQKGENPAAELLDGILDFAFGANKQMHGEDPKTFQFRFGTKQTDVAEREQFKFSAGFLEKYGCL